jgi:Signal peptidase, peptidase S26
MMAMRRIVYDNDFPAADLEDKVPPRWQPGSGWKNIDNHGFRSHRVKNDGWLNYQNIIVSRKQGEFPAKVDVEPQRIDDFLDYNATNPEAGSGGHWVGDLMLECKLTVQEPTGEFALRLNRGNYQYQARWDLSSGTCKLLRREHGDAKGWVQLAAQPTSVKQSGSYQLRFANFDSRLTVWVDGSLPFGPGFDYTPPELPTADEIKAAEAKELDDVGLRNRLGMRCGEREWDKTEPASIGVKEAILDVHHIKLWRDIYYDPAGHNGKVEGDPPNFLTMYVQPKHYLVLGDNCQSSADSRMWGLVPERLLLGRALAIYFPFDRAGAIR